MTVQLDFEDIRKTERAPPCSASPLHSTNSLPEAPELPDSIHAHFPSPAQSCLRVMANLSPEDLFRFRQLSEHRLRTRFNPKLSYLQSGGQGNPDSGVCPQGEGKWSFDPTVCFPFPSNSIPLPSQTTRQTASRPWVLLVYLYKTPLVLCECLTVVAPRRGSSSR